MSSKGPRSRQRKRSENAAVAHLKKSIHLSVYDRRAGEARIRGAKRPMVEAKRMIANYQKRAVEIDGGPKSADVEDLRRRLLSRDYLIDTPQQGLLHRLRVMVAEGCTKAEFEKLAGIIWSMEPALPEEMRKAEVERLRLDGPRRWQPEPGWLNWMEQQRAERRRSQRLRRKVAAE